MIKAVIFDCFGVLTTDGWLPFKQAHFGKNSEQFEAVSDLNQQANAGLLSHEDFVEAVADQAKVSPSEVSRAVNATVPNEQLFTFIAALKPTYKIGMLSNAAADWLSKMFTEQQLALFDEVALSYDTGHVKPQQAAYDHIAQLLEVEASECIFIDDQERHCMGAREAGMQAIQYTSVEQVTGALTRLLDDAKG